MNGLDIALLVPLVYALYRGFREGVLAQLGGIAGVVLGVWLAFRWCHELGTHLPIDDPKIATPAAFILIVLTTLVVIGLVGWVLGKLFDTLGLGLFNKVGGVLLSLLKMVLILSVLIMAFDMINRDGKILEQETIDRSALYGPIGRVASTVFPYLTKLMAGD
ncbi:MAG: CvpA family protein [Rikenellaceae bacterium]|jgi:membrane protein required for colicin V production|nr:CvpA family protein [Rikenellaceae bacterium]